MFVINSVQSYAVACVCAPGCSCVYPSSVARTLVMGFQAFEPTLRSMVKFKLTTLAVWYPYK